METVIEAVLITAAATTAGPLFLAWFENKNRRKAAEETDKRWRAARSDAEERRNDLASKVEMVRIVAKETATVAADAAAAQAAQLRKISHARQRR